MASYRINPGLALLALCLVGSSRAQAPAPNPDWPCAQNLVPTLTAGSYWDGKVPDHTSWRDDEKMFTLVTDIVDRDTPEADGLAKLNA